VSIRLLNRHTRNPIRSCISRSTSQSHPLSDSISQRASLFTYHLVRAGYSPVPSSRFTLITAKTPDSSPTDYVSSGSGSEHRIVTCAELATDPIQLKSSRACHRHVTIHRVLRQMVLSCRPPRNTHMPTWHSPPHSTTHHSGMPTVLSSTGQSRHPHLWAHSRILRPL
jgi:hypothetical protein